MKRPRLCLGVLIGALSLAALHGCGGGGAPGTPQPQPVIPGNLLMTMPPNPYPPGSADAKNFDEINRVRIAGGFGAITEHPAITQAARAHVNYQVINITAGNPVPDPHLETPGLPGFTGVTPDDRCKAAAKDMPTDSNVVCGEVGYGADVPIETLNTMGGYSDTVGHLQIILDYRFNRGGLYLIDNPIQSQWHPWGHGSGGTINVGYVWGAMGRVASDKANSIVGVYPPDGATGVGVGYDFAEVNRVPRCDAAGHSIGSPGYFCPPGLTIAAQTTQLTGNPEVLSFTLRKAGASVDFPTRLIVGGDPCCGPGTEPSYPGWALMATIALLESNTKYTATLKTRVNGVPAEKTWSFTTGSTRNSRMGG